jgi:ElaB/YqjD/DUF883 family membrane-anchored ribosome-binding protein
MIMETIETVSKFAHEAGDKIADATSQAAEALGEKGNQIRNAEQRLMKHCRGYVCDHPVTSLGIAAATGFLLSRLLSRR